MSYTIKHLATLKGEILTPQQVLEHPRSEYNRAEWVKKVNNYTSKSDCIFIEVQGTSYSTIYVQYMADGIRFLGTVDYISSLSSTTFSWGYIHGNEIHVMQYEEGRIGTDNKARNYMRQACATIQWRFFTKLF